MTMDHALAAVSPPAAEPQRPAQSSYPAIVRYRIRKTGELLDTPPTAESHPWARGDLLAHCKRISRFIEPMRPSSMPYEAVVYDLDAYENLCRRGAINP